jgi:large conductance mechanosensitive channel
MGLLNDFKAFALKGNVIDLAIGVIIGAAFGKIVTSLVEDVLMPPLGLVTGKIDFTKLALTLAAGTPGADGKVGDPVLLRYGNFLQITFQFLIVAFVIFLITQAIVRIDRKNDAELAIPPVVEPTIPNDEKLLAEIRDLLKAQRPA